MPNQTELATTLEVYVYAEDAITPINDVNIELKPTNKTINTQIQSSNSQGKIIFNNPINSNEFNLIVKDERFYPKAKNDTKRVTNSFTATNNTITLNLIPKIWLYFNGKEIYIYQGNKAIQSFQAFSGNALTLKQKEQLQKENNYINFVEHTDKEDSIFYFCLDKAWQRNKDKGALIEGEYYININESKDNKIDSGIRTYKNAFFSITRNKEGVKQWGKYNIPIYTNKDCTNTIESNTNRDNFYIHGGEKYGNNGGIDLGKEEERFFSKLRELRDKTINKNYESSDKPIIIDLIVDYTSIDIKVESIDLKRIINTNNPHNITNIHKVILIANFTPKEKSMSKKVYNAKKLQALWGYKEIPQTQEFNPNEIRLNDIELFNKNRIINAVLQGTNTTNYQANTNNNSTINNNQTHTNNTIQTNKQYQGESLEIDLVANNWHNYDKQIIVFAFTRLNTNLNINNEIVLENNPPRRVITWFNPITNPRITIFSSSGKNNRMEIAMFGKFANRHFGKHQGIDLFANIGTPVYAPVNAKVVEKKLSNSYGKTITLEVESNELEILRIRRTYINYQLAYENKGEMINGNNFNDNSTSYYLFYAHLSECSVNINDNVIAGQIIGYSGDTGNAKGIKNPHLHFEIRSTKNAPKGLDYRINPALYLQAKILYNQFSQEEKEEQQNICKQISNNAADICNLPKE